MYVKENTQDTLADMPFSDLVFDEAHPLLALSRAIQWGNLLDELKLFYCADQGRPSNPMRSQVGTLIIKHLKNLSDRDAVHYVEENLYAQRFCGLSPSQSRRYMNPASGLTNLRQKIGPEGMRLIEEMLTSAASSRSLRKGAKLIIDTTCVPLDIHYPTDIRLLERCRKEVIRLIGQGKRFGLDCLYRTYNRTARKIFAAFSKLGKTTQNARRRVHKQMFQFVRRNLKQLMDMRDKATRQLGREFHVKASVRKFLTALKESEIRIQTILHQQKLVRQGNVHIPGRIVSFHKDHVRPIVRGKFPVSTEFGPKVLFAIVRGCMYRIAAFKDNVADALLVMPALRWFKTKFGRLPKEILGDRGFYARWRVSHIRAMGITSGLQERGKRVETSPADRRMIRQRLPIEALISLGKRKFGLDRCRARIEAHETSWIDLAVAAMNVHRAFRPQPP